MKWQDHLDREFGRGMGFGALVLAAGIAAKNLAKDIYKNSTYGQCEEISKSRRRRERAERKKKRDESQWYSHVRQ